MAKKPTKKAEILAVVRSFLQEDKLDIHPLEDDMVGTELDDGRGALRIVFIPDEEYDFLQIWGAPEEADEVPEACRAAMMEAITRANVDLVFGNFYLDLDSGEWGFRIAVDYSKGTLTTEMVASMVYCANERIHTYWPELRALLQA